MVLQMTDWMEQSATLRFCLPLFDCIPCPLLLHKVLGGTRVCCAAINVNADARGLPRTLEHSDGCSSAFGYQLRHGIFSRLRRTGGRCSELIFQRPPSAWRVSAVEYCQRALGQKAARSAIQPQWLFRLVRAGTPNRPRQVGDAQLGGTQCCGSTALPAPPTCGNQHPEASEVRVGVALPMFPPTGFAQVFDLGCVNRRSPHRFLRCVAGCACRQAAASRHQEGLHTPATLCIREVLDAWAIELQCIIGTAEEAEHRRVA